MVFKRSVFETRRKPKGILRPKIRANLKDALNVSNTGFPSVLVFFFFHLYSFFGQPLPNVFFCQSKIDRPIKNNRTPTDVMKILK